jgi:hypothetical protein
VSRVGVDSGLSDQFCTIGTVKQNISILKKEVGELVVRSWKVFETAVGAMRDRMW